MSQRDSGYERKERDLYETPEWVTATLVEHLPVSVRSIWEPACGSGKMVRALECTGRRVWKTDIEGGDDFLMVKAMWEFDAIVTNPPYALAQQFIERALLITKQSAGMVAMLLRTDYDHAVGRKHLFEGCKAFAKKLVLRKRIVWFENSKGQPSFNHAWFIWDWKHSGPPILAYGP